MVLKYFFGLEDNQQNKKEPLNKLFKAVRRNDKTSILYYFNNNPKDLPDTFRDDYGNTLLHIAMIYQRIEIVKFLLDINASMNAKNDFDTTPMDILCKKKNRKMFEEYLKYLNVSNLKKIEELENYKLSTSEKTKQANDINREMNKLKTEFNRLKMENRLLDQQNRELKGFAISNDSKLLKDENIKLKLANTALNQTNIQLSISERCHLNENNRLKGEIHKLNEYGKRLREEKDDFDKENKKLKMANEELKKNIRNLVNNAKNQ